MTDLCRYSFCNRFNFYLYRFFCCLSLIAVGLLTLSFHTSEAAATDGDAEIQRIAEWMSGSYDNFEQAAKDEAANTAYKHIRAMAHLAAVSIKGLSDDGFSRTIYIEQALAESADKPYRQRIYLITRKDGNIINRTYKIANPQDLIGAYKNPEQLAKITLDRLTAEENCDLIW